MTYRKITVPNLLGLNYYIYELTSNNYNPDINDDFTITCKVTNIRGNPVPNKEITLLENGETLIDTNGVNVGTKTTNVNGEYTWTITPYNLLNNIYQNHGQDESLLWGLRTYSVGDKSIQVLVDGWKYKDGTSSSSWATQRNKTQGRIILRGWGDTRSATSSWADTGMTVTFPPRMPVIKTEVNAKIEFLVNEQGVVRFRRALTQSSNVTQSNYLQLDWTIG